MLAALRQEVFAPATGAFGNAIYKAAGYRAHFGESVPVQRAYAVASLFETAPIFVYENDRIAGSVRGLYAPADEGRRRLAESLVASYGERGFVTNCDHYAPDYAAFLKEGVPGRIARIEQSLAAGAGDADALVSMRIAMNAFRALILRYADACRGREMEPTLRAVADRPPETFREALQLVWLTHVAFSLEGRYAMAFGRMDQYLYPFYKADLESGRATQDDMREDLACALVKICERRLSGGDDVCNIAIGGYTRDGLGGVNELSYVFLEAVEAVNAPGPNLSARLYKDVPQAFLDRALQVIGTGLGYPALMNDEVNIPALARHGYALEDARDYCMVGCIENFIQGKQPPWSDGRFNTPKYLELALNGGVCMLTNERLGPDTGADFRTMDAFMDAFHAQLVAGAAEYMQRFYNENERYNAARYTQPFLSCFCEDCIGRGLDVNMGGAVYPSVHGAGCMGIGTVADALAAVEKCVFADRAFDIRTLADALRADFAGYEDIRRALLAAPKYGNDDDFADKYAVWYVTEMDALFAPYRTWDGGAIYTAIASNVSNIPAGEEIAATPDGRGARAPLSDAASPTYGRDKRGPTAAFLSLSKPDYKLVSCGTVVNQKYSPEMFSNPALRQKLAAMIRAYFDMGGQEVQINAVSRAILKDAMAHPDLYQSLVVRVSGFSAFYVTLDPRVQEDILRRTEQG